MKVEGRGPWVKEEHERVLESVDSTHGQNKMIKRRTPHFAHRVPSLRGFKMQGQEMISDRRKEWHIRNSTAHGSSDECVSVFVSVSGTRVQIDCWVFEQLRVSDQRVYTCKGYSFVAERASENGQKRSRTSEVHGRYDGGGGGIRRGHSTLYAKKLG